MNRRPIMPPVIGRCGVYAVDRGCAQRQYRAPPTVPRIAPTHWPVSPRRWRSRALCGVGSQGTVNRTHGGQRDGQAQSAQGEAGGTDSGKVLRRSGCHAACLWMQRKNENSPTHRTTAKKVSAKSKNNVRRRTGPVYLNVSPLPTATCAYKNRPCATRTRYTVTA